MVDRMTAVEWPQGPTGRASTSVPCPIWLFTLTKSTDMLDERSELLTGQSGAKTRHPVALVEHEAAYMNPIKQGIIRPLDICAASVWLLGFGERYFALKPSPFRLGRDMPHSASDKLGPSPFRLQAALPVGRDRQRNSLPRPSETQPLINQFSSFDRRPKAGLRHIYAGGRTLRVDQHTVDIIRLKPC